MLTFGDLLMAVGWYVRKRDLERMVDAYEDVFTFHEAGIGTIPDGTFGGAFIMEYTNKIIAGDCLAVMRSIADNAVDYDLCGPSIQSKQKIQRLYR